MPPSLVWPVIGDKYEFLAAADIDRPGLVVDDPRRVVEAASLGHQIVRPHRVSRSAAEPSFQALAGQLLEMGDEVLPIGALLLLGVIVNRPAVIEAMRHVVPIGGDHGVLDLGEMIQNLEVQAAAGAQSVLVQHVEHPPEADAVAVIHARIERDVRLGWPVLRQVFEELHVRCDPERDVRVVRPFDDRAVIDRSVVETPGRKGHRVVSVRLRASALVRERAVAVKRP